MYNPYINGVNQYFPNAVSVVDSFRVIQWITRTIGMYIRDLIKGFYLHDLRDLKELFIQFNTRNAEKPMNARIELNNLIGKCLRCGNSIFIDFAHLMIRNHDYNINSFVMVKKHDPRKIYSSRLSNDPIESLNRKVKDLKRLGHRYRNFKHFRTIFSTRDNPVINDVTDCNPVTHSNMKD